MGLARQMKRSARKKQLAHNSKLIDSYCEAEKHVELAEHIVKEKIDGALKEMTRAQVIHEMRTAGCVSAVWMIALNELFGFHAKRLSRVYQRVHTMLAEMNANRRHDNNVNDVIEVVAAECGIQIEVPAGIKDGRPLLMGGRAICYGPLLGTVQIAGQEVDVTCEAEAAE